VKVIGGSLKVWAASRIEEPIRQRAKSAGRRGKERIGSTISHEGLGWKDYFGLQGFAHAGGSAIYFVGVGKCRTWCVARWVRVLSEWVWEGWETG
jgi:hypothetical protein